MKVCHEESLLIGQKAVSYSPSINDSIILDLKPYTPSVEKVNEFKGPEWCSHWPKSYEASGSFDWENEFLF